MDNDKFYELRFRRDDGDDVHLNYYRTLPAAATNIERHSRAFGDELQGSLQVALNFVTYYRMSKSGIYRIIAHEFGKED